MSKNKIKMPAANLNIYNLYKLSLEINKKDNNLSIQFGKTKYKQFYNKWF